MLEIYTWSVFLTAIFFTSFGLFAFIRSPRETSTRFFSLVTLAFATWSYSWFFLLLTRGDAERAVFLSRLLNLGAIFIPLFYMGWVFSILDILKKRKIIMVIAGIITALFASISFTPFYVAGAHSILFFPYWPTAGSAYWIFLAFGYVGIVLYATYELVRGFMQNSGEKRYQIGYILLGALLGFGGGLTNFPLMYKFDFLQPVGLFTVMATPFVFGYAAMRFRLMNIKVVATHFVVGVLNLVLILRIILSSSSFDLFFNVLLFIIMFIFSIFLVRSVNQEIRAREKIQALAEELAEVNERLKELDRQKSEFVSIASHQLRSPLTAIKGYASMLLEGSFGHVNGKAKEAIDRIFQSSNKLVMIIEDFLNITRIELGRMKYEMGRFDLKDLVNNIVKEIQPNIDRKPEVRFSFESGDEDYPIYADYGKISQVVSNLIDNAIKYTPKGFVKVSLGRQGEKIRLSIVDSGIGIAPITMAKLFEKFSRAEDASRQFRQGTGLGLFVAKQIMDTHKGRIWAESPGEGMGSTFYLEFTSAPASNNIGPADALRPT